MIDHLPRRQRQAKQRNELHRPIRPSASALPVNSYTSQPTAAACIWFAVLEAARVDEEEPE